MRRHNRTRFFYWWPVIVLCALIFVQSGFSTPRVVPVIDFGDKLLHIAAYALLATLFFRAYRNTGKLSRSPLLLIVLSILSSTLYGLTDEIHQSFVSVRHADVLDLVADGVGSILGSLAYHQVVIVHRNVFRRISWIDKIMNFL
ncbi:MAG: VanZ family protein [Desulfobacteraceae bacterium]|nr:VanZ family protein [Desulfobacteraceae bacterium]